jgi:membrane fusion protein
MWPCQRCSEDSKNQQDVLISANGIWMSEQQSDGQEIAVPKVFRPQVLHERTRRIEGELLLAQPLPLRLFTIATFLIVVTIVLFLCTAQYTRKETVVGHLALASGAAAVHAPRRGTIKAIHVEEGQLVQRGAPLFSVQSGLATDAGSAVGATYAAGFRSQEVSIKEQVVLEGERFRHALETNSSQMEAQRKSKEILLAQRALQEEKVRTAERSQARYSELLGRGYVTRTEYDRLHQVYLTEKGALEGLASAATSADARLEQLAIERRQLEVDHKNVSAVQNEKLSRMTIDGVQAVVGDTFTVTAPITGRVTAIQARVGQLAAAEVAQLYVLPGGEPLVAHLLVPTRAIGFVEPGQRVRLMYEAYPFQHFGAFAGTIKSVARTTTAPDEIIAPVRPTTPIYRVIISLDDQYVKYKTRRYELRSGLLLTADILLEKRTLLEWMFEPLLGLSNRSRSVSNEPQ